MERIPVLVDCDDDACRARFIDVLAADGLDPRVAADGAPGSPRLVIVCGRDADSLMERVAWHRARAPHRRLALLATFRNMGHGDLPRLVEAGADACLPSPFSDELLVARVRSLLRRLEAPDGAVQNAP